MKTEVVVRHLGVWSTGSGPLQQKLACEERAVELPQRQNAFRHSSRPKNELEIA